MFGLMLCRFAAASILMVTEGPCAFPTHIRRLMTPRNKHISAMMLRFGRMPGSVRTVLELRSGLDRRCLFVTDDLFEGSENIAIMTRSVGGVGGRFYISLGMSMTVNNSLMMSRDESC